MIKNSLYLTLLTGLIVFSSCEDKKDQYFYQDYPETIDINLWEEISDGVKYPEYTRFVEYLKEYRMDTIINNGLVHTVFIPTNDAFIGFNEDTVNIKEILQYHISETMFILQNVKERRQLQTSSNKFAFIEYNKGQYSIDGIPITSSGPLSKDGVFYELSQVAFPRPNLYEYISVNSVILKKYIDSKNRTFLDLTRSTPIGFDENTGATIFDSVFTTINTFEEIFFPVRKESRIDRATVLLFNQQQYNQALDEMAVKLQWDGYDDHNDIPNSWQFEKLLPLMMKNGIFNGTLFYEDFLSGKLRNVTGDTVTLNPLNINPESRVVCSNGIVLNYEEFSVDGSLYENIRVEGEELVDSLGQNLWKWSDNFCIETQSSQVFSPKQSFLSKASNDSILIIDFPRKHDKEFTLSFCIKDVFPGKYKFFWQAQYFPSGIFEIYINDDPEPVRTFNLYDLRKSVLSVDYVNRYFPEGNMNKFDAWVNIEEYGDVTIHLKYIEPGFSPVNGLNIDYIALSRVNE